MTTLRRCVIGLLIATVNDAGAADAHGNYAVWGVGRNSCNQYNHAYESNDLGAHKGYLMGFLTASNALTPDTYEVTGAGSIADALTWLDQYCDEHKMESFESAISHMIITMRERRLRAAPGGRQEGWGRGPTPEPENL